MRFVIGLTACVVLFYSVFQMYVYVTQTRASSELNSGLAQEAVTIRIPEVKIVTPSQEQAPEAETTETVPPETAPVSVDFQQLKQTSDDIIAWLYSEDTPISLPVVQADDNQYYLRLLLDGSPNNAGTLFADYRNKPDFSDWNTIIYGHNMKNDTMFGTLEEYRKQEYYEEHPVMYLLTPEQDYKVVLFAGFVTPAVSSTYNILETVEERDALINKARSASTFQTEVEVTETDRVLSLSTCVYDYEDARYVLLGVLRPIGESQELTVEDGETSEPAVG
ncbi:MAG: class B sortase [Eubacteriales bacterium]|nr:class B sortase [Eubacteriales bacterium]